MAGIFKLGVAIPYGVGYNTNGLFEVLLIDFIHFLNYD